MNTQYQKTRLSKCVGCAVLLLSHTAFAATYDYTAKVRGTAKMTGVVSASGINWRCANAKGGGKCTVSGPWPTPGVSACAALAQKVGEITYYGHAQKKLSSGDLQRCNQGLASTQLPKLAAPLSSLPKSGTSTTTSTSPLAIKNTDPDTLQALKGAPQTNQTQQSTGTSNPPTSSTNKLSTAQSPSTDTRSVGKTGSIPQLDNKLGGSGLDRDQLRAISRDKAQSLNDLQGGRSIIDPHPTAGKSGVPALDQSKLDGKVGSIRPEPLQLLKGASIGKQSSHPEPLQPLTGDPIALRDARIPKSPDLTASKGNLPSGNRMVDKNNLQISKNIDLDTLQPPNPADPNASIKNKPGSATPAISGLTPPATGLKPPAGNVTTANENVASLRLDNIDLKLMQSALQEREQGPYIKIARRDCGTGGGRTLTVQGQAFGASTLKRSLAIVAYGVRARTVLPSSNWSETSITATLPERFGLITLGVVNAQGYLISNTIELEPCRFDYRISGKIGIHSCTANSGFSVQAVNQGTVRSATISRHASDDFALFYEIDNLHTGTWELRPQFNGSGCSTGQWAPQTTRVALNQSQREQRHDFNFTVGLQTLEFPTSLLVGTINRVFSRLRVRLNNYGYKRGKDSWFQPSDSYIRMPNAGINVNFNIAVRAGTIDIGSAAGTIAGAAFGPVEAALGALIGSRVDGRVIKYLYYISDLNYTAPEGGDGIAAIEDGKIKLTFAFERAGTEIIGRCAGFCPAGANDTVPDATFEPVIEVWLTPAVVTTTRGHSISYNAVRVSAANSNVNIHGACEVADICDYLFQYKDWVKRTVESEIHNVVNSSSIRNMVALQVRSALDELGIGNEIGEFHIDSNNVRFAQIPRQ